MKRKKLAKHKHPYNQMNKFIWFLWDFLPTHLRNCVKLMEIQFERKIIHFVDEDTSVFNATRKGKNFWRENVAK